jgi:pimeloyl-ACP methyl ester carboxylesterase
MDQLQIDQVKGIGFCTGAMTLMHMATQQPERLEAIVMIGPSVYITEEERAWERGIDVEDKGWWEQLRKQHKRGDEQIRALTAQFHNFKDSYDDMNFTPPYLSTITASALILHGDRDPYFPVSIAVETYQAIPNSYLWITPNGGHLSPEHPPFFQAVPTFTETALEFLSGAWDG